MKAAAIVCLLFAAVLVTQGHARESNSLNPTPAFLEEEQAAGEEEATLETHVATAQKDSSGQETTQWDSEDGGTAVVLSNDNSVSQTWDDREGRKIMAEAATKRVEEQNTKSKQEQEHKKRVREQNKEDDQKHHKRKQDREEGHKQKQKDILAKTKAELEKKREKNKEELEKNKKKLEAQTKLQKAEGKRKLAEQEKRNKADEQKSKYLAVSTRSFAPIRSRVIAPNNKIPKSNAWTYLFWVRPEGTQRVWSNLFHKGQQNINRNPAVWFFPGQTRLHIRSGIGSSWHTGANTGADPPAQLSMNHWHHVAISHQAGALRVYYNGQQKGAYNNRAPPMLNSGPLWGSDPWHAAARCQMADFRIYSRVLSPTEISAIVREKKH